MEIGYWKRLEEWVIGLKGNIFERARIKLTVFYLIITALILFSFSIALYYTYAKGIGEDVEGNFSNEEQQLIVGRNLARLRMVLLTINGLAVIFIGLISLVLSGITLRPIREAMERERQFTSDAAHELRTPLTIIKTELEVALREPKITEKEVRSLLKSNLEEIDRMSRMVENLLLLSRMDTLKNRIILSKVSFSSLVEKGIERMKPYAKEKNIVLTSNIQKDIVILGDEDQLHRLLFNLIKNAIDYNRDNGRVVVDLGLSPKGVLLTISDTGIGIPSSEIPHIFDRFYRVDRSRSQKIAGSGLGLAIVKSIVDAHNGEIRVKSNLGEGTTIEVQFPRP
ncbi:MAG: sensor histidine kinase [bacterium]